HRIEVGPERADLLVTALSCRVAHITHKDSDRPDLHPPRSDERKALSTPTPTRRFNTTAGTPRIFTASCERYDTTPGTLDTCWAQHERYASLVLRHHDETGADRDAIYDLPLDRPDPAADDMGSQP